MDVFKAHEQFELEVLERLQTGRILEQLIFGGGTMLRLCHELKRYSVDLDFYLQEHQQSDQIYRKTLDLLINDYVISDHQNKSATILVELKSASYPRRLKLEINTVRDIEVSTPAIAWSPFSNIQVPVRTVPLIKMLEFKLDALQDRHEIRDAFDIEFLLRRGLEIEYNSVQIEQMIKLIEGFKPQDFKVKLGSILPPDKRQYYREAGFEFLLGHLNEKLTRSQ